jgi:hypothetical protein
MTTNTLHVEPALTETTPGEYVTDGFKVTFNDETLYQSRFADKAVMKAAVLTADARFAPAVVSYADGVVEVAGKLNLSKIIDADRFAAIRSLVMADTGDAVEAFVEHAKAHQNHVADPGAQPEPDEL